MMSTSADNSYVSASPPPNVYCRRVMANSTLTLIFILTMLLIAVFVIYFIRYKVDIFALLHSRRWLPPSVIKTENKKYDGFICCDSRDQAIGDQLAEKLEPSGSRLCIPSRDWTSDGEFSRNIDNSMANSWTTLLLLTKNSAENTAFQEEFRNAYIKFRDDETHRLVLVKSKDYEINEKMVEDFLQLIQGKTTVVWGEKLFWHKLLYLVRPKVVSLEEVGKGEGKKEDKEEVKQMETGVKEKKEPTSTVVPKVKQMETEGKDKKESTGTVMPESKRMGSKAMDKQGSMSTVTPDSSDHGTHNPDAEESQ